MIDGIKCSVLGACHDSLRERFEFLTPVNTYTGEARPFSKTEHRGLFISLGQSGWCSIRGSLHKFAQDGSNRGDFALSGIQDAVAELAELFGTGAECFVLRNLEVGVNLDCPVQDITDNVILYGTDTFKQMSSRPKWHGVECELSQHTLKIYGKEGVRLRLEAHADKMQYFLRPLGQPFLTLGQLCESAMIAPLGDVLRTAWGKVLIRESVNVEGLCSRDADLLRFGAYGGYWTDLNRDNPELFKKKRRRFLQLQNQHRTTDRHGMIHLLTTEKWQQLLAS